MKVVQRTAMLPSAYLIKVSLCQLEIHTTYKLWLQACRTFRSRDEKKSSASLERIQPWLLPERLKERSENWMSARTLWNNKIGNEKGNSTFTSGCDFRTLLSVTSTWRWGFFCSYKQTQILPRQAHTLCFKYRQHSNNQTFGTDK